MAWLSSIMSRLVREKENMQEKLEAAASRIARAHTDMEDKLSAVASSHHLVVEGLRKRIGELIMDGLRGRRKTQPVQTSAPSGAKPEVDYVDL
mmetsp:Transcript_130786/g.279769  ORF Transcript_130786/g.279769 Transcript_130786/m.279769 type:complete len:93 (-) Transcript_130786:839-1117(-)